MLRLLLVCALLAINDGKTTHIRPRPPSLEGRIVGGSNTTIEEHPYQASLEVIPQQEMHVCGASLIRPNAALTAAHCTNTRGPKDLRIRAGTTIKEKGGETANVKSVCQHPKFTEQTIDCDITVLILDRELPLGNTIQTIPLQPKNMDVPEEAEGVVTGWGLLDPEGPASSILQEVNGFRVSDASCRKTYSEYGLNITENMICFGHEEGGKAPCSMDSGGPLVVDGKQVGVVSFSIGCGLPKIPSVYAKVFSEEVMDHIDSCLANLQ